MRTDSRSVRTSLRASTLAAACAFLVLTPLSQARAANPAGATVGAIRWDAWIGDHVAVDPVPGLNRVPSDTGLQVERSLGPHQFHDRLPFYAQVTGWDSVQVRQVTQASMDADIRYAKHAGINYWAFVWYPVGTLDIGRNLYFNSSEREGLNFAYMSGFNTDAEMDSIVDDFARPYYQKVLNGRPLFYVFSGEAAAGLVAGLRARTAARGMPTPYVVMMDPNATTAANMASTAGADAISAYADGAVGGVPYSNIITANQNHWNAHAATGRKVIPFVTVGWDNRPRALNPPTFMTTPPTMNDYAQQATAAEVATNLQNAMNWVQTHQGSSDANSVLVYAWNEFDEGGWLTPTLYYGTDRIEAVSEVLKYRSSSNWNTSQTANRAFDNNPGTNWQAAGGGLPYSNHWLEIDFGRDMTFSQVTMSEFGNRTQSYRIEYLNGDVWKTAYTGGGIGSSSTVGFAAVTGRKARLKFDAGIDTPIIYDMSYNATPSTDPNLARHESYAASTSWDANQTADKAFDGDPNTNWQGRGPGSNPAGTWLEVNFGKRTAFNTVTMSEFGGRTYSYRIEYWNGSAWATAYNGGAIGAQSTVSFPTVVASKARIYWTNGLGSPIIYEAGFYNN